MAYFHLPPLTEPVLISDVFATGAAVESDSYVVRIVGWVEIPHVSGVAEERRVVMRFVMPMAAARELRDALAERLGEQSHPHGSAGPYHG